MLWFSSDSHFGHANIIKHCNRPFDNVEQMNSSLIDNINLLVQPNDTLYYLGDFAFREEKPTFYREKINCKNIILIIGNHDPITKQGKPNMKHLECFSEVHEMLYVRQKINGEKQGIVLCHYAMRTWRGSGRGTWQLYGHSHGTLEDNNYSLSFDVGVDCHNFMPINLDQVSEIMAKKQWKQIDHHEQSNS